MQHRRVGTQRRGGVEHRRQHVVANLDRTRRGFGRFARSGRDRGHAIADETHGIDGQHGPVQYLPAETSQTDVGAGDHRVHAGHAPRRRNVDRADAGVRVRAYGVGRPKRSGRKEVGGIFRAPRNLFAPVDAPFGIRNCIGGSDCRTRV